MTEKTLCQERNIQKSITNFTIFNKIKEKNIYLYRHRKALNDSSIPIYNKNYQQTQIRRALPQSDKEYL